MKIWAKTRELAEGKFLVVRRDGSIPHWPHFVLGARDPAVPATLRFYADLCEEQGSDAEYVASIKELAADFERYRASHGAGDREAGPHRNDDPAVIAAMRRLAPFVHLIVRPDKENQAKPQGDAKP